MIGRQIRPASIIYQSYAVLCVLYAALRINRIVYSGERNPTLFGCEREPTRPAPPRVSGSRKKARRRNGRGSARSGGTTAGEEGWCVRARLAHELTRNSAEHREFMTETAKARNISPPRTIGWRGKRRGEGGEDEGERVVSGIANVRIKFNT